MWPNPYETEDLVTFTEEILNGKVHFCAVQKEFFEFKWSSDHRKQQRIPKFLT